jgi:hypothetical protein
MTLRRIAFATTLIPFLGATAVAAEPSWSALVVVRGAAGPISFDMPDKPTTEPSHIDVTAGDEKAKPNFTMDVSKGDLQAEHIDRIIGVETNTSVQMPAPLIVKFGAKDLCETAARLLSKNANVASVTCFQTN